MGFRQSQQACRRQPPCVRNYSPSAAAARQRDYEPSAHRELVEAAQGEPAVPLGLGGGQLHLREAFHERAERDPSF